MRNLTATQQADLARRAKLGDRSAIVELLRFCERDIAAIVRRVKCSAADKEDLAQTARMTVLKAVRTFDGGAGLQFRFYVARWLKTEVYRVARHLSSMVDNSDASYPDLSLDDPTQTLREHSRHRTYAETLVSPSASPEENAVDKVEATRLREVLENVARSFRRRSRTGFNHAKLAHDIVHERLLSYTPVQLDKLSTRHNISRESVRKYEHAILASARKRLTVQPTL